MACRWNIHIPEGCITRELTICYRILSDSACNTDILQTSPFLQVCQQMKDQFFRYPLNGSGEVFVVLTKRFVLTTGRTELLLYEGGNHDPDADPKQ